MRIIGTAGNDTITGGNTGDEIYGGDGIDVIRAGSGSDIIFGGNGNDNINGGAGDDVINGDAGNDTLAGDAGNDTLYGGDGNDGEFGGGGNDTLYGGNGDDVLFGDGGNDTFYGGAGINTYYGGIGSDTVIFELTSAQLTAAVRADLATLRAYLDGQTASSSTASTGQVLTLSALGATLSLIETARFFVDGVEVPLASLVNRAPVASATVAISSNEDTAISGNVGARDVDGDTLSYSVAAGPARGTLTLNAATGAYTYTPGANYNGSDSFQVSVSDGNGGFATQTINVGIAAVNDAPVVAAASASLSTSEDVAVSGQVVATDVDGDTLSYSVATGPARGTLSLNAATGAYTYLGATNYSGSDSFSIRVSDGKGGSVTQTVNATIAAVADAPILSDGFASVSAGITLNGTSGADVLRGTSGNDFIYGGAGDDVIFGNGGVAGARTVALSIAAGLTDTDGSETLSVRVAGLPSNATLSAGVRSVDGSWLLTAAQLAGLTLTSIVTTGLTLTVTATATEISNGSTASRTALYRVAFDQGTDSDVLDGGAGNDRITGGTGNNTLFDGDGNDFVFGNSGNDTFVAGAGNDTYDGSTGIDTLDLRLATQDTVVNLSTGTLTGGGLGTDRLVSIENIVGSSFNDTLTGNAADNRIDGGAGNDQISGGAGNDTLTGGLGNDQIDGGSGNDTIYDGAGNDQVTAGDGNDYIYAGTGNDSFNGGSGVDTLDLSALTASITLDASKRSYISGSSTGSVISVESFVGTAFDDTFTGSKANNFFDGGAGNDTFRGMGGADTFTGGAGRDTYTWLVRDVQLGSNYLGADTITDFRRGEDTLNLREFARAFPTLPIDQVVHITDGAAGSLISVRIGSAFLDLVQLQNVHGVTANGLLTSGDIII